MRDLNASRGVIYIGRSNTQGFHVKFDSISDPKFESKDKVLYLAVLGKYAQHIPQRDGEYVCEGIYKGYGSTACIPLKDILPKVDEAKGRNIYWSELHSNPETFVKKVAMVNLYTFVDDNGARRLNINLVCKGIPTPTEGRIKCLQKNSFEPTSPSSMESYRQTKSGADQSTKSICVYSVQNGLKHLGYTSGPQSLTDEIVSLQRQISKLNVENNPDKVGENGCFIRKSEWISPWVDTPESLSLKQQCANLQRKRTYFSKIDKRRVMSEVASMGGDLRLEFMRWGKYVRHKKKGKKSSKSSTAATQSSVSSSGNSIDSSITAQETVIRQNESVTVATSNAGTESEVRAANNQSLLVKTDVVVVSAQPETNALLKRSNYYLGPNFNRSIHFCAPGEGQRYLIECIQSLGGNPWLVDCFAGASKHRFDTSGLQKQINSLHKHSLSNNFAFVANGNDVYVVQRDALSAFNLCFIDPNTGKFDDEELAREFGRFWAEHEKLRAQFESYNMSSVEIKKSKNVKHCDYMREDVTAPTKDVLRKWRLTKSDKEALDRIRSSFGVRSLIRFHGIGC